MLTKQVVTTKPLTIMAATTSDDLKMAIDQLESNYKLKNEERLLKKRVYDECNAEAEAMWANLCKLINEKRNLDENAEWSKLQTGGTVLALCQFICKYLNRHGPRTYSLKPGTKFITITGSRIDLRTEVISRVDGNGDLFSGSGKRSRGNVRTIDLVGLRTVMNDIY